MVSVQRAEVTVAHEPQAEFGRLVQQRPELPRFEGGQVDRLVVAVSVAVVNGLAAAGPVDRVHLLQQLRLASLASRRDRTGNPAWPSSVSGRPSPSGRAGLAGPSGGVVRHLRSARRRRPGAHRGPASVRCPASPRLAGRLRSGPTAAPAMTRRTAPRSWRAAGRRRSAQGRSWRAAPGPRPARARRHACSRTRPGSCTGPGRTPAPPARPDGRRRRSRSMRRRCRARSHTTRCSPRSQLIRVTAPSRRYRTPRS